DARVSVIVTDAQTGQDLPAGRGMRTVMVDVAGSAVSPRVAVDAAGFGGGFLSSGWEGGPQGGGGTPGGGGGRVGGGGGGARRRARGGRCCSRWRRASGSRWCSVPCVRVVCCMCRTRR